MPPNPQQRGSIPPRPNQMPYSQYPNIDNSAQPSSAASYQPPNQPSHGSYDGSHHMNYSFNNYMPQSQSMQPLSQPPYQFPTSLQQPPSNGSVSRSSSVLPSTAYAQNLNTRRSVPNYTQAQSQPQPSPNDPYARMPTQGPVSSTSSQGAPAHSYGHMQPQNTTSQTPSQSTVSNSYGHLQGSNTNKNTNTPPQSGGPNNSYASGQMQNPGNVGQSPSQMGGPHGYGHVQQQGMSNTMSNANAPSLSRSSSNNTYSHVQPQNVANNTPPQSASSATFGHRQSQNIASNTPPQPAPPAIQQHKGRGRSTANHTPPQSKNTSTPTFSAHQQQPPAPNVSSQSMSSQTSTPQAIAPQNLTNPPNPNQTMGNQKMSNHNQNMANQNMAAQNMNSHGMGGRTMSNQGMSSHSMNTQSMSSQAMGTPNMGNQPLNNQHNQNMPSQNKMHQQFMSPHMSNQSMASPNMAQPPAPPQHVAPQNLSNNNSNTSNSQSMRQSLAEDTLRARLTQEIAGDQQMGSPRGRNTPSVKSEDIKPPIPVAASPRLPVAQSPSLQPSSSIPASRKRSSDVAADTPADVTDTPAPTPKRVKSEEKQVFSVVVADVEPHETSEEPKVQTVYCAGTYPSKQAANGAAWSHMLQGFSKSDFECEHTMSDGCSRITLTGLKDLQEEPLTADMKEARKKSRLIALVIPIGVPDVPLHTNAKTDMVYIVTLVSEDGHFDPHKRESNTEILGVYHNYAMAKWHANATLNKLYGPNGREATNIDKKVADRKDTVLRFAIREGPFTKIIEVCRRKVGGPMSNTWSSKQQAPPPNIHGSHAAKAQQMPAMSGQSHQRS